MKWFSLLFPSLILTFLGRNDGAAAAPSPSTGLYNIGIGIYDITGPAAGVNLMGYANPSQINNGIHIRLFARSYIVDDGTTRLVFVSCDMGMMATIVKLGVIERLQEIYGNLYSTSNVILSGTHTHSGPAGYLQYLLFDVTSLGFIQESYDALVDGIVESITSAHNSMTPGRIYVSSGELLDASINRSPTAYANNPEDEKAKYEHDTDKTMTLVKFVSEAGDDMGLINWFAVHPTSMNNTNKLVSGDNKGYASQLFEKLMNPEALPGQGKFVAAFAQSNCGDVSPNTAGPKCIDTGEACDIPTSTCGGRVQNCIAFGPGKDMEESTQIIGQRQYQKALELYNDPNAEQIIGPVHFISQYIDMSNYQVTLANGSTVTTCKPALGYSFAAGTTDGPGAFDFTQGMTSGNEFWDSVVNFIKPTDPEQDVCHHPKPVLLDTGNFNRPYPWHPKIMETQIGRIGQLAIIAVPGEFTTMSGRRLRDKVSEVFASEGMAGTVPVIAGHANVYSHYIATYEEYAIQRYEGASTIFGPHTLEAYLQQYSALATAIAKNESLELGTPPENLLDEQLTLLPGVLFDGTEFGYSFGHVLAQPYPLAYTGETVIAKFVAGHPRNDVMLNKTFLAVEQKEDDGSWTVIATDADWDTKFSWERTSTLLGSSVATVQWTISDNVTEGTFRITHSGYSKEFNGPISPYTGVTEEFTVTSPADESYIRDRKSETGRKNKSIIDWFRKWFG